MSVIDVVVGIIRNAQEDILIAQRLSDQYKGNLWEFPGGKIEPNESHLMALTRELNEEIGIRVQQAEPWLAIRHDYGDRLIQLHVFQVIQYEGVPYGKEGQPIQWVQLMELPNYEFPGGNKKIIEALCSPNL